MAKIVGIGANVFDTLIRLDTYPTEDTKQAAKEITRCGGGPCGTALVAAAKLGASSAYIGNCSDDPAGIFLRGDFEKYGVGTENMHTVADTDGFQSIIWLSDAEMSRTCVFHRGSVPPTVIDEKGKKSIEEAEILLVDGNDLAAAVEGALIAKKAGTLVLYDAGGRYPNVEKLLELTDILIPSEEFAMGHTNTSSAEEAAKKLWETYSPRILVITQGKKGGIIYDGKEITPYPAFPVEAVDTNGSGDVFHGSFAFAMTKGWDVLTCCIFSSAVSAVKCTKVGARAGVPDFETVEKFLLERGKKLPLEK